MQMWNLWKRNSSNFFNSYLKILPNPKDVFSGSGLMDFSSVSMVVDDFSVELEFVFESEDSMFL